MLYLTPVASNRSCVSKNVRLGGIPFYCVRSPNNWDKVLDGFVGWDIDNTGLTDDLYGALTVLWDISVAFNMPESLSPHSHCAPRSP